MDLKTARPLIFLFIFGFAYNVSAKKKVSSVYSEPLLMVRVKYDFKDYSFVNLSVQCFLKIISSLYI